MQQVIAIHGGTTFADYDDYINDLATKTLRIERYGFNPKWRDLLQQNLGDEYQVLLPSMPNSTNARYSEWATWFKHFSELANKDCILVGHSLGAIFLAKYLSENEFPVPIKATILVAAPYDDESGEDLTDFKIESMSELFTKQAGDVTFFFGLDDPAVPITEMPKYQAQVPDAKYVVLEAPDHFARPDFPEVLECIRSVT